MDDRTIYHSTIQEKRTLLSNLIQFNCDINYLVNMHYLSTDNDYCIKFSTPTTSPTTTISAANSAITNSTHVKKIDVSET